MSGIIDYELEGFTATLDALRKLSKEFEDTRPELMAMAKAQAKRTRQLFNFGGEPTWEDITYMTRRRRKERPEEMPLNDTYSLRDRVTALESGVEGSAFKSRKNEIEMGSTEERAAALQNPRRMIHGTNVKGRYTEWREMPARPFLYFEDDIVNSKLMPAALESVEDRIRERFKLND